MKQLCNSFGTPVLNTHHAAHLPSWNADYFALRKTLLFRLMLFASSSYLRVFNVGFSGLNHREGKAAGKAQC